MAFKRSSDCKSLVGAKTKKFGYVYKFNKLLNFKEGDDAYFLFLGLEDGFYETPYHRVAPHKVNGVTVGLFGSQYAADIKCDGIDAEGNKKPSVCCELAQKEIERLPEDYAKRIISRQYFKVHVPVLVLGNSLNDTSKKSYPVSKVSILNELKKEGGLTFAFIDMSSNTFKKDVLSTYGKKLKEEGILDYELEEDSEEYFSEILKRLTKTVVKAHGSKQTGLSGTVKEYSFFPFDNAAIASGSAEGEREAIIGYKENPKIMSQVNEFLALFESEVDNLLSGCDDKTLLEYYESALKAATGAQTDEEEGEGEEASEETEKEVEVKPRKKAAVPSKDVDETMIPSGEVGEPTTDDEIEKIIRASASSTAEEEASEAELASFEYDTENDEEFFNEE